MTDDPSAGGPGADTLWPIGYMWNDAAAHRFEALRKKYLAAASASQASHTQIVNELLPHVINAEIGGQIEITRAQQSRADMEQRMRDTAELHAGQIEGWTKEAEELQAQITASSQRNVELRTALTKASAELVDTTTLYQQLMDEHHETQLDLARHQGYVDRVRELDPKPKKTKRMAMLDAMNGRHTPSTPAAARIGDGYGAARFKPWYRRTV